MIFDEFHQLPEFENTSFDDDLFALGVDSKEVNAKKTKAKVTKITKQETKKKLRRLLKIMLK